MNPNQRWLITFLSSGFLILAFLAWVFFAPAQLGGNVEYVIITGNSMQPGIQQNDLILVRANDHYKIGDAVAYDNPELDRIVFHRIIDGNSLHYTLQGDNNTWVDSYQPSQAEIIGKQWFRVAKAGKVVEWTRKPYVAAAGAAIFGGFIMALLFLTKKPKKVNTQVSPPRDSTAKGITAFFPLPKIIKTTPPQKPVPERNANKVSYLVEIGFFLLGFFAIAFLILFLISMLKPTNRQVSREYPYTQTVTYEYNAPAPAGIYDSQALTSGDPIFTNLTCQVNVIVAYNIQGIGLETLNGTHQVKAILTEPVSGWMRTFPLETQQTFTGDSFTSPVLLDLCQIQSAASLMQTQTGTTSYTHNISIEPNVTFQGSIRGEELIAAFNVPLVFQMDAARAFPRQGEAGSNPLQPVVESVLSSVETETNTINLLFLKSSVSLARFVSTIGLILSIAGLFLLISKISKASKQDKDMLVRMKYGSSMVDVEASPSLETGEFVRVKNIDDLARLAEKLNTVILHHNDNGQHVYYVEAFGLTYLCMHAEENQAVPPPIYPFPDISPIQQGLLNGEFTVHYQPIVSIRDRKLEAVEAFIRWKHPERGNLSAAEFIGDAEASGDIVKLGEFVFSSAIDQLVSWKNNNIYTKVAINISKNELKQLPVNLIVRNIRMAGLSPSQFQIEFSQDFLLDDDKTILHTLHKLHKANFLLALENHRAPLESGLFDELHVDFVKIDRSVLTTLDQSQITSSLRVMINSYLLRGINVVANGVETRAEIDASKALNFTHAQGYLFAKPAGASEITPVLMNIIDKEVKTGD
jgi:signal peptidase I